jgi:hypothetical protein
MHLRTAALAVCLAGSLSAVIVTADQKRGARSAPLALQFLSAGNLQVGVTGELLPEPIAVQTTPGAEVRFYSPDLGLIEESGAAEATVIADAAGLASVHVRLGANLGRYTVIASPARGDGSEAVYTFRALDGEAMQARKAKLARAHAAQATRNEGGGQ